MNTTYEQYVAMGLDDKTARYFAGGRRRIVAATPEKGYRVILDFDNGERRVFDCSSEFGEGSLFNRLVDESNFARVFVDECGNLAWDIDPNVDSAKNWNNRIDLCRDACYMRSVPIAESTSPSSATSA